MSQKPLKSPEQEKLRAALERRLLDLPMISLARWKDTESICVLFKGKECAHFHGQNILDLRLSRKIIREEQLSRSVSMKIHPNRSQNSRWIGVEFENEDDIDFLIKLGPVDNHRAAMIVAQRCQLAA